MGRLIELKSIGQFKNEIFGNEKSDLLFFFLLGVACKNIPVKNKKEKIDYLVQKAFNNNEFIGGVLVADQASWFFTEPSC